MNKLSPDARSLIEDAQLGERPSEGARARVRGRVIARVAAGAAAGSVAALGASGSAAKGALATGVVLKWVTVVGLAGTLAVGAGVARHRSISMGPKTATAAPSIGGSATANAGGTRPSAWVPPVLPVPDPDTPSAVVEAPPVASSGGETTTPVVVKGAQDSGRRPVATRASGKPAGGTLEAETDLLQHAQSELRAGRADQALKALDEHGTEFQDGVLREERKASRILALCALGRTTEARAEAQRFLAASPRSPMAERVRTSCAAASAR